MPSTRRLLTAVSLACLAACATRPTDNPPSADTAGRFETAFTTATNAAPGNDWPFNGTNDHRIQQLYLAGEVGASGRITALKFRLDGAAVTTAISCPRTTVRLAHTSLAALGGTFASNVNQSPFTTVVNDAPVTIPPTAVGDWFTIPLATAFEYDGQHNLVVEIETLSKCTGTANLMDYGAPTNRRAVSTAPDTDPATAQHNPTTATLNDGWHYYCGFVFAGGDLHVSYGSGGNFYPFASDPDVVTTGTRFQFLYPASDIKGAGPITALGFEPQIATTDSAAWNTWDFEVWVGHATTTTLSSNLNSNWSGAPTRAAARSPLRVPPFPAAGPLWIPFQTPFTYDGTRNLLVEIRIHGGTRRFQMKTGGGATARRAWDNLPGGGSGADSNAYNAYFRFAGSFAHVPLNDVGGVGQGLGLVGQMQSLYPMTRLGAGGAITQVGFRMSPGLGAVVATSVPNAKIWMGSTTKTALAVADTYQSSMDGATLVYSGPIAIPASPQGGAWVTVPLQSAFTVPAGKNLVVLFTSDGATPFQSIAGSYSTQEFPAATVYRNDNTTPLTGTGQFSYTGFPELRVGTVP